MWNGDWQLSAVPEGDGGIHNEQHVEETEAWRMSEECSVICW